MGGQVRAAGRAACRRHRVHDREIHRCLHQCLAGLAGGSVAQYAERRPVAAAGGDGRAAARRCLRQFQPARRASSTAMPQVRARTIRNCATATASISGSTIRRWCSAKRSFSGTPRRAIPVSTANSSSAAGAISAISPTSVSARTGLSLADPASGGTPATLTGDFGIYSVFEQKLYRVGARRRPRHRHFLRASYSSARSQYHRLSTPTPASSSSASATSGRRTSSASPPPMRGCRPGRARLTSISSNWLDRPGPSAVSNRLLTAVYQYEIRGGWTLQPNFQYIVHPGGGATNPLQPGAGRVLANAAVFGLRTVVKF